ncbi:hypothetical protein [Hymenobacter sp. IS2118]|uniref:hypothetical protein n=1 Tax=Hymenobacter sp. IS2118 TaxID=1505605 RepID=UPI0005556228|nr:hypothetical protein [Hymenobacter sp. IS2118]
MKYLVLLALLIGAPTWQLLTWVHDRNAAVAAGAAAYARGEAAVAATSFKAAMASRPQRTPDPRLVLNLAHAQARAGQLVAAQTTYARLLAAGPKGLSSVARQQLAVQAAQQGEIAQALASLRQALLLDPGNRGARYNYEVLSEYLTRRPNAPRIAEPPAPATGVPKPSPEKEKNGAEKNQPAEKEGTTRKGEVNEQKPAPPTPNTPPERRPDPAGQPGGPPPAGTSGQGSAEGRAPGSGTPQAVASGATPGTQRGLDRTSAAPGSSGNGRNSGLGTEAATASDAQLQTQRERLKAMNLSPAQARQLLETLRAQEQQYLQQLTRPVQQKPDPSKPTW